MIFITGTDTGAGKTVVTALLLEYLISQGVRARAVKPFCAGSLGDPRLLARLQGGGGGLTAVSPFQYPKPLAPGVQEYPAGRRPGLEDALRFVRAAAREADVLLVEGCGGLMVPLGPGFMVLDLVRELKCPVLLVAANRLGAINQVLLSLRALEEEGVGECRIVLNETESGGRGVKASNAKFLGRAIGEERIGRLGFMREWSGTERGVKKCVKKVKKDLVWILGCV